MPDIIITQFECGGKWWKQCTYKKKRKWWKHREYIVPKKDNFQQHHK